MPSAEAAPLAGTGREPVAVEEAFAMHYSAVFRQVQRLMRDPEDSYDLTLTAWEKAQRAWDRRPSVALEIKPWLFRIARNACVDELRRRQLVRWEPLEGNRRGVNSQSGQPSIAPASLLTSDTYDPEREMLRNERAELVRRALRRLPNRYRICLLMREAEGLSCEEIGARLALSSGAVRTTLCRARQRLRLEYIALGGEPAAA
ncbi:MAG: sigma-70 family RNA polymerase sigma factor [Chloroflexota bacterium]|nr:sigma-70 family RNA polymerase sigma factor [Chloroflexota bacterium]